MFNYGDPRPTCANCLYQNQLLSLDPCLSCDWDSTGARPGVNARTGWKPYSQVREAALIAAGVIKPRFSPMEADR